jgi:gelsolin
MAGQAKLEDSNIAGLGSRADKDLRLAAAQTAEEWKGAGQKEGIEIWRIEKLKVVPWPKNQYGTFFDGDSFIVLHTYTNPEQPEKLLYNVHFWLGKDTSQDEAGVAAYKTVELDDLLGQLPVQFREVQGFESEEFLKLFHPGIKLLSGGVESGFNKVKPEEYKPRLMHVKGSKKSVKVTEVGCSAGSMNEGDVFILDAGLEIYQWNGTEAAIAEKRKANEVTTQIREERLGKPKVTVLDGLEENPAFWSILGDKSQVKSAAEGGDDAKVSHNHVKKLFKVSDASGALEMTEVASGSFNKELLDSNDVFIVDTEASLFVWVGLGANKDERASAFKYANDYLAKAGRPLTTPVVRVVEGSTNPGFEGSFGGGGVKHPAKPGKKH